jgi:lysophospholipase L1-like esterase
MDHVGDKKVMSEGRISAQEHQGSDCQSAATTRGVKEQFFCIAGFLLLLIVLELLARGAFIFMPEQENLRRVFTGQALYEKSRMNAVGQPYLLYVPRPGFSNEAGPQHNVHGYRGEMVSRQRQPGSKRVLCLGGSTTYGSEIAAADQTWPAHLQNLLRSRGFESVEVINGGLRWASSAELLTHYQFKWHYYRPDLVILNTGGNDAGAFTRPYYHPDYSHWRQHPRHPRALGSRPARWLLRSRMIAAAVMPVFFGDENHVSGFGRSGAPPAYWYHYPDNRNPGSSLDHVPNFDVAFQNNIRVLIDIIESDGARVMLVAFRPAPVDVLRKIDERPYSEIFLEALAKNEKTLHRFASEKSLALAPFPASAISADNWVDRCHVNERGALEKAKHIANSLIPLLQNMEIER